MNARAIIRQQVALARRMNSEALQWKAAGFACVARLFISGRNDAMRAARRGLTS
jgi:hypothetical protein